MSKTTTPAPRVRTRKRAVDVTDNEGTIIVNRTRYGMESEDVLKQAVRVPLLTDNPARVRVSGSATKNLGDYNSVRVEVMVELPCLPEESEVHRAYLLASDWVDGYVGRELRVAQGEAPDE